ncbi:MAG: hypothetical protein IAF02_28585 [Anaerolineae bacterium]|nr:hypothetical protein [Anaerolineae bacterium]
MLATVKSINNVSIRLTKERWEHVLEEHGELAQSRQSILDTVANPSRVLAGGAGELFAIKEIQPGKWLVVVYREDDKDGFIITAFLTRREQSLNRRKQLWP